MSDEERKMMEEKIQAVKLEEEKVREKTLSEARMLIANMKISSVDEMPKPLVPGTVCRGKIELETNLFGIKMAEDKMIYQYDIDISCDTGKKIVEFTRKGRSDYMVTDRKKNCMAVFNMAIKETGCFREDIVFFYDGQSILFTTEKLVFKDPTKHNATVHLDGGNVLKDLNWFKDIAFVIKECAEKFECHLSDIRKIDRNIATKDRSAMQFVDVATSMYALSQGERFTIFAHGKMFPNRPDLERISTVPMKEGKVLISGMSKSIKLIEGPRGRHNASPALAIDSLKVAFHVKEKLIDKAKGVFLDINRPTITDIDNFHAMVRGLGCMTTHMKNEQRRVEIHGISRENSTHKMEVNLPADMTRTLSVAEYFKTKYDLDLKYPLAPLVMIKERGQMNMYPMEVLDVIPMQRVTIPQTTSAQSQVATKECAVAPGVRQNAIAEQCKLHDLFNEQQPFLKAAGLGIISNPLRVSGRLLKGPMLKYKAGEMEVQQPAWRPPQNYQFIVPASCERWAMYAILGPRDQFGPADLNKFAEAFVRRCRDRGMKMGNPLVIDALPAAPQDKSIDYPARMKIKEAAYHNVQFIFFITNDNITIHKHLKLQESYSNVVTQDLKLKTANNFLQKGQTLTMDNIVSKTNVKLGGVNYSINLKNVVGPNINPFPAHRLFLGIGVSHAPPSANYMTASGVKLESPTVVGYCANMGNETTEFIGDFLYQDNKKDDLLLCTAEMLQNVIDRFTGLVNPDGTRIKLPEGTPRPKPLPRELIIYRQGVAEGFYAMCMKEEVPLMKAVLARNGAKECKLTYVIVQKEHNIRLMPIEINTLEKATVQNIGSGVVVDSQLTHPRYREFFLNSHVTLQGTARTPRYTVLHDDAEMSMNELQSVTHALAFNFQIVNSPVSLPTPLYVANRYAERGVALFTAKTTDDMASSDQRVRTSLAHMNEDLTFGHTKLGAVRINA